MNEGQANFPQGVRVLVVEDEALIADEIEDRLRRAGCQVVGVCDNAAAALAAAHVQRPDLALMDIRIKGPVDGIEAARQLYSEMDVPVVFLTAHSDRATLDRALGMLPFGYVLKPFQEHELLLAMELALRRVVVERGLRETHLTRRAVLESLHEGVVVVDAEGHVRYLNPSAERLTGWTLGAALTRDLSQVLALRDEHDAPMPPPTETASGIATGTLLARSGRSSPVEVAAKPVEHLGVRLGWALTLHDVSARQLAQRLEAENQRMREASRLKSLFLANMSHELRTPLNAVLGFAELLSSGAVPADSPKHDEYLRLIASSGRHLLQLINDVLDLAKVEAGKLQFHAEKLDAAAAIDEVVRTLSVQADEKRLQVTATVAHDLAPVRMDALRFKQVLFNYLSNAIKFTEPGGRIDVRAVVEDEHRWRLEVEDSGAGIEAHEIPHLFSEFGLLYRSSHRSSQGAGLSLALTKRLVEAQHGRVGVSSRFGVGSRFFAVLPRDLTAAAAHAAQDKAAVFNLAAARPSKAS